jgi:hypothetical protein
VGEGDLVALTLRSCPAPIELMVDLRHLGALPRPVGAKLLKCRLRGQYWAGQARRV